MDFELRAAERSGDLPRLIKARSRAGRCPGCGDPGKHANEKVKTIFSVAFPVGTPVGWAYEESDTVYEASGEWWETTSVRRPGNPVLVDPCGFAYGLVFPQGIRGRAFFRADHALVWSRFRNGVLGRQCPCGRPADVMSPDFVLFWRNALARRIGMAEQAPFPMCCRCVEKEREETLDTLGDFEEDHSISVGED